MNEVYNSIGSVIKGSYKGEYFEGEILDVRVKYGQDLSVQVAVDAEKSDVEDSSFLIDASVLYIGGNDIFADLKIVPKS